MTSFAGEQMMFSHLESAWVHALAHLDQRARKDGRKQAAACLHLWLLLRKDGCCIPWSGWFQYQSLMMLRGLERELLYTKSCVRTANPRAFFLKGTVLEADRSSG